MKRLLVLAEKKTLAEKIAKGIGKYSHKGDHYEAEGNGVKADIYYLFGHILKVNIEKSFPEGVGHFPTKLSYKVQEGKGKLYKAIKAAIERALKGEYDYIVSAGDPDREGELLVREVLEACKVPKEKVLRAWWNAETAKAVAEGVLNARPLSEYDALYAAGKARREGDLWLGINLSRKLHEKTGNRNLSLGRVQTPVLALVVKRYLEHKNFKPTPYWVVGALLEKEGVKFTASSSRIDAQEEANKLLEELKKLDSLVVKKVEKKLKKQAPPKLAKLSDVQQAIGNKLGLSADRVLAIIQGLYQRGILSYPRTEANYLSEGDLETVREFLEKSGREKLLERLNDKQVLKRIVNNKAVEKAGHHALVPIDNLPDNATKEEKAVYEEILGRLLANLDDDYEYEVTTATFEVGGRKLTAKGSVPVKLGWRRVYGGLPKEDRLPPLKEGESVKKLDQKVEQKFTKPPALYTSASLIGQMTKLGLGTEATRANYEKLLIQRGYLKREKGKLVPTEEGLKLYEQIKHLSFVSPEETARWEEMLQKIAFKEVNPAAGSREFLEGVKKLTLMGLEELEKSDLEFLKKKPSEKMVKYAKYLAEKLGVEVDEAKLREDWEYCRKLIDEMADKVAPEPPTEKQLELAKKVAQEQGVEIPEEALKDKLKLAKWLDRHLKKGKKKSKGSGRKGSKKGRRRKK